MFDLLAGFAGVIQVILGFGALIFVHELGHFLVAKRCGVRVDEFSLGFGPYLLTWKKGPTLYALRAIPLGGFVQMRGQNDLDPSAGGDAPDSYNNQSIPKRMAIIVAGVIMNAVFAVVLLVFAFWLFGIRFVPAVIDEPDVGSGAAEAGLKRGDEIIAVDGKAVAKFHEIRQVVALSDPDQGDLDVTVRRKGEDTLLRFRVTPQIEELAPGVALPSLGVRPNRVTQQLRLGCTAERCLWVHRVVPFLKSDGVSPAAATGLRDNDTIIEIDGHRPTGDDELIRRLQEAGQAGQPLRLLVRRQDGKRETIDVLLSPAAAAGMRANDIILEIDGRRPTGVNALVRRVQEAGQAGQSLRLLIRREDGRRETLDVTPRLPAPRAADASGEVNPQDSAGHGLAPADGETNRYLIGIGWEEKQPNFLWEILTVQPGGPAEQAGLRPGDVIAIELPLPWEVEGLTSVAVQRFADDKLSKPFHVDVVANGEPLHFQQVEWRFERHSFLPALDAAWHESLLILRLTYRTLQRLLAGHVPIKGMTGPVGIIRMTYQSSKPGFGYYLWFLAMISINLAVLNLLPIPVLDGGHLVFLTLEAVRRRPLSQRVQEYALWSGLAMLLSLILYVTWNDVMRLFGS